MNWEYNTIKLATANTFFEGGLFDEVKFNNLLNGLGRGRWELVSVFDTNTSGGSSKVVVAVFKRPIER